MPKHAPLEALPDRDTVHHLFQQGYHVLNDTEWKRVILLERLATAAKDVHDVHHVNLVCWSQEQNDLHTALQALESLSAASLEALVENGQID